MSQRPERRPAPTRPPAAARLVSFRLETSASTPALARVVSALHAGNIEIDRLGWSRDRTDRSGIAVVRLDVRLDQAGQDRLSRLLARIVEVRVVESAQLTGDDLVRPSKGPGEDWLGPTNSTAPTAATFVGHDDFAADPAVAG